MNVGGEDLCDPLGMESEKKGRPQQMFCYRAGDEAVGLGLEGAEGEVSTSRWPISNPKEIIS